MWKNAHYINSVLLILFLTLKNKCLKPLWTFFHHSSLYHWHLFINQLKVLAKNKQSCSTYYWDGYEVKLH